MLRIFDTFTGKVIDYIGVFVDTISPYSLADSSIPDLIPFHGLKEYEYFTDSNGDLFKRYDLPDNYIQVYTRKEI